MIKKSILYAGTFLFFLSLFSCTVFQYESDSYITFSINRELASKITGSSARQISYSRSIEDYSDYYVDVSIYGDVEKSATLQVSEGARVTFDDIAAGKNIYAEAVAYTLIDEVRTELYSGVSDYIVVQSGENVLSITLSEIEKSAYGTSAEIIASIPSGEQSTQSGSSSSEVYIENTDGETELYVQFNSFTKTYSANASAVNIINKQAEDLNVYIDLCGENAFNAANHGGLKLFNSDGGTGLINVIFYTSSSSSATLTLSSSSEEAIQDDSGIASFYVASDCTISSDYSTFDEFISAAKSNNSASFTISR